MANQTGLIYGIVFLRCSHDSTKFIQTSYLGPQLTQTGFQHRNAQDIAPADKPFYALLEPNM